MTFVRLHRRLNCKVIKRQFRRYRAVTQRGFSTVEGVQGYIDDGGTARSDAIAQSVAQGVLGMIPPTYRGQALVRRLRHRAVTPSDLARGASFKECSLEPYDARKDS